MKIKLIAGTIISCIVINNVSANAFQISDTSMGLELENGVKKDERIIKENSVIRKKPNQLSVEVDRLSSGTKVEVIKIEDVWAQVKLNTKVGYIELDKLKAIEEQVIVKYLDGLEYINVYSEMNDSSKNKIGRIENNEKIFIKEEIGQYIKIRLDKGEGYIKNVKNCLVDEVKKVLKEDSKMYIQKEEKITEEIISKNEIVVVEEVLKNYYKVKYKNNIGYIEKEKLKEEKHVGYKNLNSIKLYVEPSEASDIRTYIPSGANVDVMKYSNEYAYVQYGEYNGYIEYNFLNREELELANIDKKSTLYSEIVDIEKVKKEYEKIDSEIKNKRKKEKAINKLKEKYRILEVEEGTEIRILKNNGLYFEVEVQGNRYYMRNEGMTDMKKLEKLTYIQSYPKIDTSKNTRYTNEADSSIYLDKEGKILLGLLVEDSQVELIENLDNGLSKVNINNYEVYVKTECLSKEKMYTEVDGSIKAVQTGKSHKSFVEDLSKKNNIVIGKNGSTSASIKELAYYSNPEKNSVNNKKYKYQYLKLDTFRMVNTNKLNEYLNSLPSSKGKVNIFKDKADIFVQSAKKYNIDPIYLVAHALLETGQGKSNLAQGQNYRNKGKVYNFFGIGAIDSDPLNSGVSTAYKNGWSDIDKAIEGSARWIADNYIHLNKNQQNTLYKMRYNYMTRSHMYATDIKWSIKISEYMSKLSYMYEDTLLEYEVPKYKKGTYTTGVEKEENNKEENPNDNKLENEGLEDIGEQENNDKEENNKEEIEKIEIIEKPLDREPIDEKIDEDQLDKDNHSPIEDKDGIKKLG